MMLELNKIYCGDCLELMREMDNKSVDLVLTDPPYGIGFDREIPSMSGGVRKDGTQRKDPTWRKHRIKGYETQNWDNAPPDKNYFNELFRISKEQIIFGGNYFSDILPPSGSWIVWDKKVTMTSLSKCELAWSSIGEHIEIFRYMWAGYRKEEPEDRNHPTQKPLLLMMWCLEKYSKPGMTVLDPFMGSGTTCVACKKLGRNYIGIDKEPAYVEIARKRLEKVNNHKITDFFGAKMEA